MYLEHFSQKVEHTQNSSKQICCGPNHYIWVREGFKKKGKKRDGFIHRGWLPGVSLGPKSNQKKNCWNCFKQPNKWFRAKQNLPKKTTPPPPPPSNNYNDLCVLPQNDISDKILLVLWWWLSIMIISNAQVVLFSLYSANNEKAVPQK